MSGTSAPLISSTPDDLNLLTSSQLNFFSDNDRKNKILSLDSVEGKQQIMVTLRDLGQPIKFFGESDSERFTRLENIIRDLEELYQKATQTQNAPQAESHSTELWYHEGSPALLDARLWIAYYSLCRVKERLENERAVAEQPEFEKAAKFQEVQKRFKAFEYRCSQLGDDRPLTYCQISPDGTSILTTSKSGIFKQWDLSNLANIRSFKGHTDDVCAVVYHPTLAESDSEEVVQAASCCGGGYVLLWNLKKEEPVNRLPPHRHRVSRVAFHPSGRFLGSACFDKSWRLFDLQKNVEVLHQEGHSRECFNLAFHCDGSLAVSAGFDARALVWDLRTGRCVIPLDEHLKRVVAVDISRDGFTIFLISVTMLRQVVRIRRLLFGTSECKRFIIPSRHTQISFLTSSFMMVF